MPNFLSQMSVSKRLSLSFAVVLLLSLISMLLAISQLSAVGDDTRAMMADPLKAERLVADWTRNIHAGVRRTSAIARSSDPSLAAYFKDDQEESTRQSGELQKALEPMMNTPQEKHLFEEIAYVRKIYIGSRN